MYCRKEEQDYNQRCQLVVIKFEFSTKPPGGHRELHTQERPGNGGQGTQGGVWLAIVIMMVYIFFIQYTIFTVFIFMEDCYYSCNFSNK